MSTLQTRVPVKLCVTFPNASLCNINCSNAVIIFSFHCSTLVMLSLYTINIASDPVAVILI